ncbi:helix-turn-helix domain-containing protein [Sphingobacterium sp. ML3W]|uniref:helix-turn-helix domain-containing protein n=1 Tax=Sphingobacterium sp. ML3W TaxID=1538644 RepID=UPI00249C0B86|nr:helix-turn-helix transcriptional regulator [Sphingobacterium sp. ML3W]WFA79527.1 helix-turn-helix domain-containing protein [Sphingobacterium sp. ML3W]
MGVAFQEEKIHEGKNLKRIREIMGMKQEALGQKCESKFDQRKISNFESLWTIPEPTLEELANALGVTVDFIRAFNEEKAIYYIQHNRDSSKQNNLNHFPTITYESDNKIEALLEKLVQDDAVKTKAILDLTKVVADLAEEVKRLKVK